MNRPVRAWPVLASLACAMFDAHAVDAHANASDTHASLPPRTMFDTRLLRGASSSAIDLSRFERGDPLSPGLHSLDVIRNGASIGRRMIRFAAHAPDTPARPCFDRALADAVGLAIARLTSQQRTALGDPQQCVGISELIPAARAQYDPTRLALGISIPQAALVDVSRDAIDPALREAGIPAFRMSYALNALHHDDRHRDAGQTQASVRTELGANAGRWRWRHRGTHTWRSGTRVRGNTLSATLEHDVDRLTAQFTLGDFHTRGVLFDTIGLRGVRLESDDRMLPSSFQRYAPVVRGVANTHARVQVRQGAVLLYDTTVAPGPFALRDVQPLGFDGALDVRVVEADGQVTTFSVPYTAIPGLLRPGHAKFALAAGRWRGAHADAMSATDVVFQGTMQRGVRDHLTVHAGAQFAPDYAQALGGVAVSTIAGAFSIDRAHTQHARTPGRALRVAYAGRVPATDTTIDIAAWRHGSDGFRSLNDAMRSHTADGAPLRERTRTDASVRHVFGHRGNTLTFGLVDRAWRGARTRQRSLRLGWAMPLARHGLLQASFDHAIEGRQRATSGVLSLSLPLDFDGARIAMQAHARIVDDHATLQASATGAFGRDRRHTWSGGLSHATHTTEGATIANATIATHGHAGHAGIGLSASRTMRQWSATAEGSALLYARGATFGMPLGDTVALLRAPQGQGAAVLHQPAVRLDRAGHALVPHLSPYRRNSVGVAPEGLPEDVHFAWTERSVVPRAGAVVEVVLPATNAPLRRLHLVRANGQAPPFAADVRDMHGVSLGTVGRNGVVVLRAPSHATHFDVHWREDGETMRCRIQAPLPADRTSPPLVLETPCTE